jgi:signal transduction histidine kinase
MIAAMRLVLAASGLLIIYLDPVEPDRLASLTYAALILYAVYSGIVVCLPRKPTSFIARIGVGSYWIDVASYTVLVALSSGTNSIFFFGYFFAVLVAAFVRGYLAGVRVTLVSVLLFSVVSLLSTKLSSTFEVNRFLLRPVDLAVLGYMISYWGGYQLTLTRRLAFLNEISRLNPRFGFDQTVSSILQQLIRFYDAVACIFVAINPNTDEAVLRRVDRRDPRAGGRAEPINRKMADALLSSGGQLVIEHSPRRKWWQRSKASEPGDRTSGLLGPEGGAPIEWISNLLDAGSLISVALRDQDRTLGRIYLAMGERRNFDRTEEAFIIQVAEHIMPVLESIRLADRLATEAAERERQRIARDIHDSIIQPYIGLQMGLAGVRQRLSVEETDVKSSPERLIQVFNDAAADTDRLIALTADGITDLRGYIHGLREAGGEDSLLPAVRRFAAKFTQATNIVVQIRADEALEVDRRLSVEVFQIIVEGLSNIRRHTRSQRGFIGLERENGRLVLRIENDGTRGAVPEPFIPRSITERAQSLGGQARVEVFGDMGVSVIVEVPI